MEKFGLLSLATPSDWHKAMAMAWSCKLRSPNLPLAIAGNENVLSKLEGVYDYLIPERSDLRGFAHKLYLDEYSPFERTLFIDADMLIYRDLNGLAEQWTGHAYAARGCYRHEGVNAFGFDSKLMCSKLGVEQMVEIGGAGHAYFEKPTCHAIFDQARKILADYETIAPGATVADEDIINIVMTKMNIEPTKTKQIVGFLNGVDRKTLEMDTIEGKCKYIDQEGDEIEPYLLHFPRDTCPILYHREMKKLSRYYRSDIKVPWMKYAREEWLQYEVRARLSKFIRKYSFFTS